MFSDDVAHVTAVEVGTAVLGKHVHENNTFLNLTFIRAFAREPPKIWVPTTSDTKPGTCTILIAKTKALISCAVAAQLICIFVFAYANVWFSDAEAHNIVKLGYTGVHDFSYF